MAVYAVVLAVRIRAGGRHGGGESAGTPEEGAPAYSPLGLVDARTGRFPTWYEPVSLTDYLQFMPDRGEPGMQWPRDVVDEIVGMRRVNSINDPFGVTEVMLRGGETIRMQPGKEDPTSIVTAVREVMRRRENALLAVGEVTDPVAASIALDMLYKAAGWAGPQRTDCPCCKVFALEGCILPPGADLDGEAGRCTYTDDCRCWGGLRDAEGERWCEDCRADWLDDRE